MRYLLVICISPNHLPILFRKYFLGFFTEVHKFTSCTKVKFTIEWHHKIACTWEYLAQLSVLCYGKVAVLAKKKFFKIHSRNFWFFKKSLAAQFSTTLAQPSTTFIFWKYYVCVSNFQDIPGVAAIFWFCL